MIEQHRTGSNSDLRCLRGNVRDEDLWCAPGESTGVVMFSYPDSCITERFCPLGKLDGIGNRFVSITIRRYRRQVQERQSHKFGTPNIVHSFPDASTGSMKVYNGRQKVPHDMWTAGEGHDSVWPLANRINSH